MNKIKVYVYVYVHVYIYIMEEIDTIPNINLNLIFVADDPTRWSYILDNGISCINSIEMFKKRSDSQTTAFILIVTNY